MVWMASFDSEAQVRYSNQKRPWVSVSRDGQILPEVKQVIGMIAKYNLVMATGHPTAEEALLLFATPREAVRSRARVTGRLGTVTADTVKQALSGNGQAMVVASVTPVAERWNELPATTRRKLGSAAVFNQHLQEATEAALTAELNRVQELTEVRAALRSKLQVALAPGDLPPGATMHQVELTLRSEDIDLILAPERTGGA